ncbi:MAG: HAD family hydrolase [bacterium]|nr:HAD family hydrolase [bacterium]
MKHIRFLVFDLDGTLIDSSDGVVESTNYSLRMMGEPEQPPEKIKPYIGFPLTQMFPAFTDAPVAELYRHFRVKADEVVVASSVMLDGVQETLRLLRNHGYKMAIATTKVRVNVDGTLDKFSWRGIFDTTVGGDEVAHVKPAPDAFLRAVEELGGTPETSLAVGDTINDVLAAQAVPMEIAAVNCPYGGHDEMRALKPDFTIGSIRELPALLGLDTPAKGDAA